MSTEETTDESLEANSTDKPEAKLGMSVAPGISVPQDSNIIGGGTPGEGADIGTASGPSDSGGG
jgi:hypothetical protein